MLLNAKQALQVEKKYCSELAKWPQEKGQFINDSQINEKDSAH